MSIPMPRTSSPVSSPVPSLHGPPVLVDVVIGSPPSVPPTMTILGPTVDIGEDTSLGASEQRQKLSTGQFQRREVAQL